MIGRRVSSFAHAAVRSACSRAVVAPVAAVVPRLSVAAYSTLGELVAERTAAKPRHEVLRVPHQDIVWDNTDLKEQSDALACGLLEIGYTRGSKLALWLANETEHLCAVLAASRIGCTIVSIDPHANADAVRDVLKAEGCRGLMFGQRFKSEHRGKAVQSITDLSTYHWGDMVNDKSMRKLRHLINTGHEDIRGVIQYKHFPVYNPSPNPLPSIKLSKDDVLIVPYTASADGAASRGEPLTQGDLISTAKSAAKSMSLGGDDVVCVAAWQHSRFGLAAGTLAALHAGAKVIIPAREENASAALNSVAEFGATAFVGRAHSLADAPGLATFDLSSLRSGLLAGAAAPPELTGVQAIDEESVQVGKALA